MTLTGWSITSTRQSAGGIDDWRQRIGPVFNQICSDQELKSVIEKILSGSRITKDEGLALYKKCDLATLSHLADSVKRARFEEKVFYNRNLHINQTNICTLACRFCAFRRGIRGKGAYELTIEDYLARVREYDGHITEIHSVGGLHPEWGVEHYEKLFHAVKSEFPHISIKALSAVEVKHISELSEMTVEEVLCRLQAAGLDALPGGGAEILNDDVREIICKGKESSSEYLQIHETAHKVGLASNCTMLFGTIETHEMRIEHLVQLRELQDRSSGFQCFVPYPFLADNTRLPEARLATPEEVLRVIAISRLMLDNIPHIKAYRMNIGDELASVALLSGADDIDGTVSREEIMHAAGSTTSVDEMDIGLVKMIEKLSLNPFERNTDYTAFRQIRRDPPGDGGGNLPLAYG